MRPSTLARLAVAGNRTDVLRTVLTALSAMLATIAMLCAATVLSIRGYASRYTVQLLVEPGLRPGVAATLVLVALPVLALAGQCIRLGAPARDRRLAAIRLAGATPGEAVLIATAETAVASLLGSVLALIAYLVARALPAAHDQHTLPSDVLPPAPVLVFLVLLVPVLAALIGALLMRRVIVTPLGVVRRVRERGPRPWPGLLIIVGLPMFAVPWRTDDVDWARNVAYVLIVGGTLLTMAGVVLGVGWISHTAGRLMRRFGRGPAMLLAAQRLITDPWNGSRTMAALLVAVIAGAVALAYKALLATQFRYFDVFNQMMGSPNGEGMGAGAEPDFYFGAIRLVMVAVGLSAAVAAAGLLVALAESIVARRRTYASLTATGVPRRTLSASILWQTLTPIVPALLLALAAGDTLVRLIQSSFTIEGTVPRVLRVPVPWADLGLLGGGALLAVLLAVGVGLLVLRSSTDLEELRIG
ncbi:FtsX-like permease family protein [Paractinoplanes globisporus]|uniref:FtsX-like permease family protein n=1 Tax=Paractinoplanes globisporus TaxID=113565 RepID=A0ABW6WWZ1_9ACTN|nr:FtsX-like permease family protein [Actinoplanes globisporus]